MEISEFTLKLILLLIPGAIASLIFVKLTTHTKWNTFKFLAHSILFGSFSYLLAIAICSDDSSLKSFWKNLPINSIPYGAIWKASLFSIVIGLLSSAIDNYKLLNRLGRWLRISRKYGDMSAYALLLNDEAVEDIYFRDFTNKLTYHGIIESFSETDTHKEIILRTVKVYEFEAADLLYEVDKVYLCKQLGEFSIEVPRN